MKKAAGAHQRAALARHREKSSACLRASLLTAAHRLGLALLVPAVAACPVDLHYLESGDGTDGGSGDRGEASTDAADDGARDASDAVADGGTLALDAGPDGARDATNPDAVADATTPDAVADATGADAMAPDADARAPVNILVNPGFESGVSPWTTFSNGGQAATLTTTTAFAHSGSQSGMVSARTASFEGVVQDIRASAIQGQLYTVSAWALVQATPEAGADAGSMDPVDITVTSTCQGADGGVVGYITAGSAQANGSTWVEVSGQFTVPVCTLTTLLIYVAGPPPGVNLFVDDVTVAP
jgi:hypothetical protein